MDVVRARFLSACALASVLLLAACGGNNAAGNNTNSMNGTPTPGSTNPGTNGGAGSGGSGSGGSSTSSTYVYAGTGVGPGAVRGYKLESSLGTLAEVSGSPVALSQNGSSTGGVITAASGYVYGVNRPGDHTGVSMYALKADGTSGTLAAAGAPVEVTPPSDSDARSIKLSADGRTAYVISQWSAYAVALNNGTPAALNSQNLSTGEVWGFAVAGHFAYAGVQDGNPKSGFAQPVIKRMAINADGSLGTPQTVMALNDANTPYDLAADTNGKYLAATTGFNSGDISVWNINSTSGDLSAVSGSPFSTSGGIIKLLRFNPSGTHLYAINNPDFDPRHEDVRIFAVAANGALSSVQTLDLGDGQQATDFRVEDDFAYIANVTGSVQSTVTVLRRDNTSGQLSVANKTSVASVVGGISTLHF